MYNHREVNHTIDEEAHTSPLNKLGARPKEPDEKQRDYDDYLVGAAIAEPSAATACISPPPTLSVGPRRAQLPSLDRSELSAFGRQILDVPLQKGMSDTDSVRKEIKFLEEKFVDLRAMGQVPLSNLKNPVGLAQRVDLALSLIHI